MADNKMIKAPKLRNIPDSFKEKREEMGEYNPQPHISFSENELPEILDWKIDGKYTLIVEVEMRGISECDYGRLKGKKEASFRVTKVGVQNGK